MIWQRNAQPGETALQKQRQMPRHIAMQLLPRHLQQFERNDWTHLQKHPHMMTAFEFAQFTDKNPPEYDIFKFRKVFPLIQF